MDHLRGNISSPIIITHNLAVQEFLDYTPLMNNQTTHNRITMMMRLIQSSTKVMIIDHMKLQSILTAHRNCHCHCYVFATIKMQSFDSYTFLNLQFLDINIPNREQETRLHLYDAWRRQLGFK